MPSSQKLQDSPTTLYLFYRVGGHAENKAKIQEEISLFVVKKQTVQKFENFGSEHFL